MGNNRKACSSNLMMLAIEKKDMAARETKGNVNPLDRLEEGAWSLAFLDLPSTLLKDQDLLGRLEVLVNISRRVNSTIQSRENFQLQHLSGDEDFYFDVMRRYGGLLTHDQQDLLRRIDEALRELTPFITQKSRLDDFRSRINHFHRGG